jgi:hypothetical protein
LSTSRLREVDEDDETNLDFNKEYDVGYDNEENKKADFD